MAIIFFTPSCAKEQDRRDEFCLRVVRVSFLCALFGSAFHAADEAWLRIYWVNQWTLSCLLVHVRQHVRQRDIQSIYDLFVLYVELYTSIRMYTPVYATYTPVYALAGYHADRLLQMWSW